MSTAGLLLAAGGGTRFGGPKALAVLNGQLLVERGIQLLADGGCDPIHVVLGAALAEVQARADLSRAVVVANPAWPAGMSTSLHAGLASMPATVQAVVIALVDQPRLSPLAIRRVQRAHAEGATVATATYAGRPGHPVLLDRSTWADVIRMSTGDEGARAYLRANPSLVTHVACDDLGSPVDVDRRRDLDALAAESAD
jgi:CTP:molybdopterin cytidylyltransferase MocA